MRSPKRTSTAASDEGYTLVELSVALAVTAVVIAIALFLFLSVSAGVVRGQHESETALASHIVWRHLSNELRRSNRIAAIEDDWLVDVGDSTVTYAADRSGILRNGERLLDSERRRTSGAIERVSLGDSLLGHRVEVSVRGAGADSAATLSLKSFVRPRSTSVWPELTDRNSMP